MKSYDTMVNDLAPRKFGDLISPEVSNPAFNFLIRASFINISDKISDTTSIFIDLKFKPTSKGLYISWQISTYWNLPLWGYVLMCGSGGSTNRTFIHDNSEMDIY